MNRTIKFKPIGIIASGHTDPAKTPIQPVFARGCKGRLEVFPEYEQGLADIEGFSHILITYLFHRAGPPKLVVKPYLEDKQHGVFATRAPCRPNPLGISLVRLIKREGPVLYLDDLDILDDAPVLDIKPYISRFEVRDNARCGWQDDIDDTTAFRRGRRNYRGD
ncbi:MAG: tRNA (N6-threonylcarbamoyladenosine(37)-N6)-methyltransferase TrmO [Chitinivibrionales bacterium]|nr:tRNA (N6-threonylcarbamoyladenosine(37)-N6)-methyltransferase TrmO [Chitinivibrionales bacterium]